MRALHVRADDSVPAPTRARARAGRQVVEAFLAVAALASFSALAARARTAGGRRRGSPGPCGPGGAVLEEDGRAAQSLVAHLQKSNNERRGGEG